ncbi:hypothetical protein [Paraliobacillus sp. X-1268]|uniref:hypothetical protein n=1 Tax=Paraliobacillus sp. X-1268 TaxID=2213193 RepID=UPI000E3EBB1F|nr:hypothetical protein [Paraliobacillus sp. X-1268]
MSQGQERELGWDDEIEKEGGNFVLLPKGDYNFTVAKFERGRFQGSEKMPPCNQAKLELTIHSQEHGDITVFHNLMLHTKTEGFLSNFFAGIGQKKPGEKLRMNWNAVVGAKGRCKIVENKYMSKGEERVNNQVDTFYSYEEYLKKSGGNQQQAPAQNQAPFPTGQPQNQQQNGGFVPGQF